MYAWYKIDKYRYGIILYDVMGHGLSAALVSMSIRSLLRGIISKYQEPTQVIRELNYHIYNLFQDNERFSSFFFTTLYILVDSYKKEIQYANAGHPPGLLLSNDGTLQILDKGCIPCGIYSKISIDKGVFHYQPKAKILIYTDGLIDSVDSLGVKPTSVVEQCFSQQRGTNSRNTIQNIRQLIKENKRNDDICIVCATLA
ncbi:hypothetical protein BHU72_03235 [Desulfuribacillus stibiiarsenatis]|uniref:PPM-type phosphatase domain-containing protein n=2 Tax=Desulfuribacillus stibiiarsenatis TaxID=1390249 RepID=A0A1E5L6Y2_9FIRM|nr:hypothetical protein BHU72_03235 [Desulfuribacillus stibiiarsenatis]